MTAAQAPTEFDRDFALSEYRELGQFIRHYVDLVTSTERYAVAGAAAFASFSVSGLTASLERAQVVLSAIPFLIVALAGLRCLTLYMVIRSAVVHLVRLETALVVQKELGFNRIANDQQGIRRAIEATSGGYWALACIAAAAFWFYVNDVVH